MKRQDRIAAFISLGKEIRSFLEDGKSAFGDLLRNATIDATTENPWFTEESVLNSLQGIVFLLEEKRLSAWAKRYDEPKNKKNVACILAGNIPAVGFHDILCILSSGHYFVGKLSSKDKHLIAALCEILWQIQPDFRDRIRFVESLQNIDYDAVIATGSNNSARYFEHYFRQKPHIIRKGRSSVAILTGKESKQQQRGLADDIFMYFGLGCRNVSKIYIPKGFDIRSIFPQFEDYQTHKNHHKWMNNYEYNRSIYLINQEQFYETGFAIFKEDKALLSPIAVVYYEVYESLQDLLLFLEANKEQLQGIISEINSKDFIPLGKAQYPEIGDYADGVDTMDFLQTI